MEKGQLGTQTQRRLIFVWEGAVARLPGPRMLQRIEWVDCHMKAWDRALGRWEINTSALQWMWSFLATTELRIDLAVTTRPPGFAQALARRVEHENWPIRYVFAVTATDLGRLLPAMPDVVRVYYGLEEQRWAFGPQGFHLTERDQHP